MGNITTYITTNGQEIYNAIWGILFAVMTILALIPTSHDGNSVFGRIANAVKTIGGFIGFKQPMIEQEIEDFIAPVITTSTLTTTTTSESPAAPTSSAGVQA